MHYVQKGTLYKANCLMQHCSAHTLCKLSHWKSLRRQQKSRLVGPGWRQMKQITSFTHFPNCPRHCLISAYQILDTDVISRGGSGLATWDWLIYTQNSELLPMVHTWCFHQRGDSRNQTYDDHDVIEVASTRQWQEYLARRITHTHTHTHVLYTDKQFSLTN